MNRVVLCYDDNRVSTKSSDDGATMDQEMLTIPENVQRGLSDIAVLLRDERGLWLVALLCGLSILLTALWLLTVLEYVRRTTISASRLHAKSRMAH